MAMTSSRERRREPWRNAERHYCEICNVWMGSDRQSILLHENGKKHKENVQKSLIQKRKERQQEERDKKLLQDSLKNMEQVAARAYALSDTTMSAIVSNPVSMSSVTHPDASRLPTPPSLVSRHQHIDKTKPKLEQSGNEMEASLKRRRYRREAEEVVEYKQKQREIQPDDGFYQCDEKTFLEGHIFSQLLENEMPIQLWTGPLSADIHERRLPQHDMFWKNALVIAAGKDRAHVAYLASADDEEETVEKSVVLDRIRILLGSHDMIPDTLEEARLMASGGEHIEVQDKGNQGTGFEETTGLSSWSTVTIKRTTIRQESKEERARLREKRKLALEEQAAEQKKAEGRKMEEAKVANADDSALGAYDVWGKGGYKGVKISALDDTNITVADTAIKSAACKKTSANFKKRKKGASNRNRRITSADD